jgi:hypothetical protein
MTSQYLQSVAIHLFLSHPLQTIFPFNAYATQAQNKLRTCCVYQVQSITQFRLPADSPHSDWDFASEILATYVTCSTKETPNHICDNYGSF